MAVGPEMRREEGDHYNPEAAPHTCCYSRAIDDDESPVPPTRETLGGKGLSLVEMTSLGLPVPPGFILTTDAWREWKSHNNSLTPYLLHEVTNQLSALEHKTGKRLNDPDNPLFVSVRSGAPVSMPGAMTTLLNVGLNDQTVQALASHIGEKHAWKSYLEMMIHLGFEAYGMDYAVLDDVRKRHIANAGVTRLSDLPVEEFKDMVDEVKELYRYHGSEFPQNPAEQITSAVAAVFASWDNPEALRYRQQNAISDDLGTAAILQEMAWGNSTKEGAGAGVLLTRNIQTAERTATVAYVGGKQGTAVVGERGNHKDVTIDDLPLPEAVKNQLHRVVDVLEKRFTAPQDVEFTFDGETVWVLQTRDVPLQPVAHIRILLERLFEGQLTQSECLRNITVQELRSLLQPPLDPGVVSALRKSGDVLSRGTSISLGNASGIAVSSLEEALEAPHDNTVLVMHSINLPVMTERMHHGKYKNIVGVVAGNGGIGSHIARVGTRVGWIPILFGADTQNIPLRKMISVDGGVGEVYRGFIPSVANGTSRVLTPEEYTTVRSWYETKTRNPWRFMTDETTLASYIQSTDELDMRSRLLYSSPKAQAQEVINALVPQDIRIDYTIVKANEKELLRSHLNTILESGRHVTLRTCYTPDRRGRTPWVVLTTQNQVMQFLDNPDFSWKYGGYGSWIPDPELTEVLVGAIPKDKLSEDPDVQSQHGSWTLTCTESGEIILQVRPHTAQLRGHEEAEVDDLVTYRLRPDASDPHALRIVEAESGEHLADDERAQAIALQTAQTILSWWRTYDIPERMAAAAEMYQPPAYSIPVLEGQTRVGESPWCLVYGMKIDKME